MARFALLLVCLIAATSSEAAMVTIKPTIATTSRRALTRYARPVWNAIKKCTATGYNPYLRDKLYYCVLKYLRRNVRACLISTDFGPTKLGKCYEKQSNHENDDYPAYYYEGCLGTYFC